MKQNTTQSNIEKAETVANIVQIGINGISGRFGGDVGKAFANALIGNGAILTAMGDF